MGLLGKQTYLLRAETFITHSELLVLPTILVIKIDYPFPLASQSIAFFSIHILSWFIQSETVLFK